MSVNSTRNSEMVEALSADFRRLYNPAHAFADAVAMLQAFPGLRGLWTLGQYNASGLVLDISGNDLHLSGAGSLGAPALESATAPLAPKTIWFGTDSRLFHTDSPSFDIIGNESYVRAGQNLRGLTIGMWVRPNSVGTVQVGISKWAASNFSYSLTVDNSGGNNSFFVSGSGTTAVGVTNSGSPLVAGDWVFICGRYRSEVPDLKVWMNGVSNVNSTSVPSTLFNGNAQFRIGQRADGTGGFIGRGSFAFLCHAAVPDAHIEIFYEMTAPMYKASL